MASHSHSRSLSVQPNKRKATQDAKDAARLAEWNSKRWVWVQDKVDGYKAGWVVKEENEQVTVALQSGEILDPIPTIDLLPVNPPTYDGAEDIADLTYLNEASVVHNLKTRFAEDSIYTYSGLFLVAVNPYKPLPIYSQKVVERYKNRRRDENAPHVYAVTESALRNMLVHQDSQSILVTGESGAGKTENTKKVIQYLAAIATDPLSPSSSVDTLATRAGMLQRSATVVGRSREGGGKKLGQLERQILEANPILEAFGNAQTVKNNNSSRFGKFVRIFFNSIGAIAGANIDWYLLEKSRVTARSEHERGFHIFFQLLRGADRTLREQLLLSGDARDYEYLKHSRQEVDGMDDREEWKGLLRALDTVGFTSSEQLDLFKPIAAILHLGNVSIGGTDQAFIVDPTQLEKIAHLLGIPDSSDLLNALVRPRVKAGREWVVQARTNKQVVDELAAMSKALYEKNFGKMVERINQALGRPSTKTFIGVLDIAGFEIFETNGFEQLCINYTNEKLQQFFNHHMFVLEQEEYGREQISWEFRSFGLELQPTIDLIDSNNPMGILSALDDACIMPKATDETFTEKLKQLSASKTPQYAKFTPARFGQGFTVSHYAGNVEYRTDGWLDKNRDPLSDNLTSLLAKSHSPYVAQLFSEYAEIPDTPTDVSSRTRVRKGAFRTVGQRHKDQLSFLMSQLRETQPHFVRCIVPNLKKAPGLVDTPLVLDQLRCNGVLEGIRIARLGFPNRLPFAEFRRRFEVLSPPDAPKGFVEGGEACRRILNSLELDPQTYQLGVTKVFFKTGILAELEERRDDFLGELFTRVQAACRKFVARRQANKILNRAAAVRTIQRNARVYGDLKAWPWWLLFQRVRPLLAAARSDHEVRRKAEELAAAKEKAESEEQARLKLQEVTLALEAKQEKLEQELTIETERSAQRKELLLQSKKREAELEEDMGLMKNDIDILDQQREEAIAVAKNLEQRIRHLDTAVANSTTLIATLQREQANWKAKEAEWASQTSVKTAEWKSLLAEREASKMSLEKYQLDLTDVRRERARLADALSKAEEKLAREGKDSAEARQNLAAVEAEARKTKDLVANLERQKSDLEKSLKAKESELAIAQRKTSEAIDQRNSSSASVRDLEIKLSKALSDFTAQSQQLEASRASQAKYDAQLNSLQDTLKVRTSDNERQTRLNEAKEAEVQNLRFEVSKISADLARTQKAASAETTRLRQQLDQSLRDAKDQAAQAADLARQLKASSERASSLERETEDLREKERNHELQMALIRNEVDERMLRERNVLEGERAVMNVQLQKSEDAVLASQRFADAAKRDKEALQVLLEEEQATVKDREALLRGLQSKIDQQNSVIADQGKIATELRAELRDTQKLLRLAEDRGGKTIVEHVRVLEEAQRIQGAELETIRGEQAAREAYVKTLERQRISLTHTLEDIQAEKEKKARENFHQQRLPRDNGLARLQESLDSERKTREMAESNVDRLNSDVRRQQTELDAARREIASLKSQNIQMEQELNSVAASDHAETLTYPRDRRMQESRAVNVPSPTRNTFNAHKSSSSWSVPPPPPPSSSLPSSSNQSTTNGRRKGYE